MINLGIRRELFQGSGGGGGRTRRGVLQAVYSSNPDRGLQELAALWPEIVAALQRSVPRVAFGCDVWLGRAAHLGPRAGLAGALRPGGGRGQRAVVDHDVIFTGRLSKAALADVLMQSDVCLYPCNFFETFCLTVLECQAAGLRRDVGVRRVGDHVGGWCGREDSGASGECVISAAVRAGSGGWRRRTLSGGGPWVRPRGARGRRAVRLVGRGGAVAAVGVGIVTRLDTVTGVSYAGHQATR